MSDLDKLMELARQLSPFARGLVIATAQKCAEGEKLFGPIGVDAHGKAHGEEALKHVQRSHEQAAAALAQTHVDALLRRLTIDEMRKFAVVVLTLTERKGHGDLSIEVEGW